MPHWTFYQRDYSRDPRREPGPHWQALPPDRPEHAEVCAALPGSDGAAVRWCPLPFYRQPSHLAEVLLARDPVPRYAVHCAGAPSPVHVLDGTMKAILEFNRRVPLGLEPDNVADYVCFVLAHHRPDAGRLIPVERLAQVRWRSEPREGERQLLGRCLRAARVEQFQSTGSFELSTTALRMDNLVELTVAVSPFGQVSTVSETGLLWGLPVVNDTLADLAAPTGHFGARSWDSCAEAGTDEEIRNFIRAALPPGAVQPGLLLSRSLSFLPEARLYRAVYQGYPAKRNAAADDPAAAGIFVLRGRGALYLFDGPSQPLHQVCGKETFALAAPGAASLDPQRVLDYVAYFCRLLHGEAGPFRLIEDVSDLNVARAPQAETDERMGEGSRRYDDMRLAELAGFARPLQLIACGPERAVVAACVLYDDSLFGARLVVEPGGMVTMEADSPAVTRLPVNWVRNTSPFRRRRAAA